MHRKPPFIQKRRVTFVVGEQCKAVSRRRATRTETLRRLRGTTFAQLKHESLFQLDQIPPPILPTPPSRSCSHIPQLLHFDLASSSPPSTLPPHLSPHPVPLQQLRRSSRPQKRVRTIPRSSQTALSLATAASTSNVSRNETLTSRKAASSPFLRRLESVAEEQGGAF